MEWELDKKCHYKTFRREVILSSVCINLLGLALPLFILQLFDRILQNQSYNTLYLLTSAVVLAIAFDVLMRVFRQFLLNFEFHQSKFKHEKELINVLTEKKLTEYKNYNPIAFNRLLEYLGDTSARDDGRDLVNRIDAIFSLLILLIIYILGGWLVLVSMASILLILYFNHAYSIKISKKTQDQKMTEDQFAIFQTQINAFDSSFDRFRCFIPLTLLNSHYFKNKLDKNNEVEYLNEKIKTITTIFIQSSTIILVIVGACLVNEQMLTVGGMAACTLLNSKVLQPLAGLFSYQLLKKQIDEFKDLEGGDDDCVNKESSVHEEIRVADVSYIDKSSGQSVQFNFPACQITSLIGDNGSGKSHILKTIKGLYPYDKNKIITINDDPLDKYSEHCIDKNIEYISADPILFPGSIIDNITLFDESKTNKAIKIMRLLGFFERIARLPNGYNTQVKEEGVDVFSRGMMQQLCFARAFLSMPKILLIDEANCAMDNNANQYLYKALTIMKRDVTIIFASHDQNLIALADHGIRVDENV